MSAKEKALPARAQVALGELIGAPRERLLAWRVGAGLGVVHELIEEEVAEIVGPKRPTLAGMKYNSVQAPR